MKKYNLLNTLVLIALVGTVITTFAFGKASAQIDPASGGRACTDDTFEPNDTFTAAKPVVDGAYSPLAICAGNHDYYQIELVKGQQLTVDLTFTHNFGDLDLHIYKTGQTIDMSSTSLSDNESVTYRAAESGIHYIHVFGYSGTNENNYAMQISLQCADCISYQGQLQSSGANASGQYEFEFKLYDALAGGAQIGETAIRTLAVANGLFSAERYFGNPADRAGVYPQFLNIAVRPAGSTGPVTPLSPRTELTAAPIAHTLAPGALISDTEPAPRLHSPDYSGLIIQDAGDGGIQISNAVDEGVYIANAGETGVFVDNAAKSAIAGQNTSDSFPAGLFVNTVQWVTASSISGGVGVYARGKAGTSAANPDGTDLVLSSGFRTASVVVPTAIQLVLTGSAESPLAIPLYALLLCTLVLLTLAWRLRRFGRNLH